MPDERFDRLSATKSSVRLARSSQEVHCIPERVGDFGFAMGDARNFVNQLLASHIQQRRKRHVERAHSFLIQLEQKGVQGSPPDNRLSAHILGELVQGIRARYFWTQRIEIAASPSTQNVDLVLWHSHGLCGLS